MILFSLFARLFISAAESSLTPHPAPTEFSPRNRGPYVVTANGRSVPVFHAAEKVYFASFDFIGQAEVKVTARKDGYWQPSAILRPLSRSVVPRTEGRTVSFTLDRPGQFSVERPGTTKFDDEVLFVFANAPEQDIPRADDPNVIWLGPGLHHRNVDLSSGQVLYLAPGAVLFGGVNVWDAEDVRIRGRGAIVYYGPQSLDMDMGWVHEKNWHPLTTHAVKGLAVEGVTFVGRSRTWTIQMWMTSNVTFDNVKIIGLNPGNVNCDGIDWYGGGHATVRDSLIRSADDCFAFLAPLDERVTFRHDILPWDADAPVPPPGPPGVVSHITVERCVLWPTRGNPLRVGLRDLATLETHHVTLRDCDVIHNDCLFWRAPHALYCVVSESGKGDASQHDYLFENIRFEERAAILGLYVPTGRFRNFHFKDIEFAGGMADGLLRSDIDGLVFENVRAVGQPVASFTELKVPVEGEAKNVHFLSATK